MINSHVKRLIREDRWREIVGLWDVCAMSPAKLAALRRERATEYVEAEDYDALQAQLAEALAVLREIAMFACSFGNDSADCGGCRARAFLEQRKAQR